jgi:hypothetical protein
MQHNRQLISRKKKKNDGVTEYPPNVTVKLADLLDIPENGGIYAWRSANLPDGFPGFTRSL